jgi:hypothetical protein
MGAVIGGGSTIVAGLAIVIRFSLCPTIRRLVYVIISSLAQQREVLTVDNDFLFLIQMFPVFNTTNPILSFPPLFLIDGHTQSPIDRRPAQQTTDVRYYLALLHQ